MKKVFSALAVISLLVSAFALFFVAVGATFAEADGEESLRGVVPDHILEEQGYWQTHVEYLEKLRELEPSIYTLRDKAVTFTMKATEYGQSSRMYDIAYTVKGAYLSDTAPEGIDLGGVLDFQKGNLSEGYTFLVLDVILENRDNKKQMYMMNCIMANSKEPVGFEGAEFKNSARLHAELYPEVPLETSLVYVIPEKEAGFIQISVDNFGSAEENGGDTFINIEGLSK